ncbi:MAG: transporter [Stenotrophomonas sp.]|uniref:transporter n=1 Tax=Stenotrophomonas sp. TaxID=69392 RepID=UPI003D6CEE5C
MKRRLMMFLILAVASMNAWAGEAPEYDRPGIGFSTSTVGKGVFVWEQGLPDGSRDRSDGITTTAWTADTLLRLGLSETIEVQFGADTWSGLRVRGAGIDARDTGGGDGSIAVKWAPAMRGDQLSLAFKGGATLPWGRAPLGDGGNDYDLGVTAAWALPGDTSLALYADRQWGDSGSGWLFSPSYGFPLGENVSAYVEGGYGTGAQYMRAAGAGMTWMATPRLQLDASFLRGLDDETIDWQGGVGMALYFD